jgi:hypothetical protein
MQQQQKREQESLIKFAQVLRNREIELLQRELKLVIEPPTPLKRRIGTSKLKVSLLRISLSNFFILIFIFYFYQQLLKKAPDQISFPSQFRHKITVTQSSIADDSNQHQDPSLPGSPAIKSRLKVIARE